MSRLHAPTRPPRVCVCVCVCVCVRVCVCIQSPVHVNQSHFFRPNEWQAAQALKLREAELEQQFQEMRRQLTAKSVVLRCVVLRYASLRFARCACDVCVCACPAALSSSSSNGVCSLRLLLEAYGVRVMCGWEWAIAVHAHVARV